MNSKTKTYSISVMTTIIALTTALILGSPSQASAVAPVIATLAKEQGPQISDSIGESTGIDLAEKAKDHGEIIRDEATQFDRK